MLQKPLWFKIRPPHGKEIEKYAGVREQLESLNLHTVCEEAKCPNINECWGTGTATFMVLGNTCTRGCRFCAVKTAAKGLNVDPFEPVKLARAIAAFSLSYVVITSVDRDDLQDQGAGHFVKCVREVKRQHPQLIVELLIPDFRGSTECIDTVLGGMAEVVGHNIETVERLQGTVRDRRAGYDQSLGVLEYIKQSSPETFTKSSIMLGLGEKEEEVLEAMDDLRGVGVDFLTLGQYLRPSKKHIEVKEFVRPEKFEWFAKEGEKKGFKYVAAGPMVRSSYRAGEFFVESIVRKRGTENA